MRPTARGILLLALTLFAWLLADLTRIQPARALAAAGLLILAISAACILLALVGLHAQRTVLDDAVPAGHSIRVRLDLRRGALLPRLPLGRAAVREHLPAELGGEGDLALRAAMPHLLVVQRRGNYQLGPYSIIARDLFGLFHLRRTIADTARVTGLPTVVPIDVSAARAAGISTDGTRPSAATSGIGEISPIARPYASGDDMRRVHWRATARAGKLMTREDEPSAGLSAVIVIDTTRRDGAGPEVEDRLISHAASVLEALGTHGWQVRVVDAGGDEIARTGRRRATQGHASPSPIGHEADALTSRAALLALAEVGFDDDPTADDPTHSAGGAGGGGAAGSGAGSSSAGGAGGGGAGSSAGSASGGGGRDVRGFGRDHAAGQTALAVALGVDDGDPFSHLDLDRFAGRAAHRTAIALRAAEHAPAPQVTALGSWALVRGTAVDPLSDLLAAVEVPR